MISLQKFLSSFFPFSLGNSTLVFREYETALDGNGAKGPQPGAYIASEKDELFHLELLRVSEYSGCIHTT